MRKWFFTLLVLFCSTAAFFCPKAFSNPDDLSETEERAQKAQSSLSNCLTKESYQLADELGLIDLLTRLQQLKEHERHKRGVPLTPESTTLRLEISEVVLTTSLQCQAVNAQIEAESSSMIAIRAAMEGRRDKTGRTNAIANVVANGSVQAVGSMLQEPVETVPDSRYELPGEVVASAGTLMAAGLGAMALKQSKGMTLSAPVDPNMLAKIFKRPNSAKTEYPDVIWRYLNSVPPDSIKDGPTRRELLIQRWIKLGRIPSLETPKGRLYARTVAGTVPQRKAITLDMLDDRIAMLMDLRAEVNQIYNELLNMMLVVRAL
jgi:hypothetical protein